MYLNAAYGEGTHPGSLDRNLADAGLDGAGRQIAIPDQPLAAGVIAQPPMLRKELRHLGFGRLGQQLLRSFPKDCGQWILDHPGTPGFFSVTTVSFLITAYSLLGKR